MTKQEITERIKKVLALLSYSGDYKPESKFIDDMGLDSLDLVELVMGIEEEFETSFTDEEMEEINTVNDLQTFLEKKFSVTA